MPSSLSGPATPGDAAPRRSLANRHIQLIALGGAIGAGLFLSSGATIATAGPSTLIAYAVCGLFVFLMARALGELTLRAQPSEPFVAYITRHVGPRVGFITGWTYWINWVFVGAAEITAAGVFVRYWFPGLPQWIPVLAAFALILALNLKSARIFAEAEFWLALVKVTTILVFVATGGALLLFPDLLPTGRASLANLHDHGGFFATGLQGLILVLPITLFAFGGVEVVALAAREATDPQRSIPRAINSVIARILIFYVGAMVVAMSVAPWTSYSASESPFVSMFDRIGVPFAGGLINFVVLTAVLSAANTGLFATGRMVAGLAEEGLAPAGLGLIDRRGLPMRGLLLSAASLAIVVLLNWLIPDRAFIVLISTTGYFLLWVWAAVMVAHLNMRHELSSTPTGFRLPLHPYANWLTLAFIALVLVLLVTNRSNAAATALAAAWFAGAAVTAFIRHRRSGA